MDSLGFLLVELREFRLLHRAAYGGGTHLQHFKALFIAYVTN